MALDGEHGGHDARARQDTGAQDVDKALDDRTLPQAVTIMTTEHYALQGIRAATIADSSSRATLFLGTVSSTLVALAFVGQVSKDPKTGGLGEPFYVFSLVLFPSLLFLGVVTFDRVLQSAVEESIASRAINRIRHYYIEILPRLEPYFMQSRHDDTMGATRNMGAAPSRWQLFLDTAGMIAVLNSVIAGVLAGLIVSRLIVDKPLALYVLSGAVAFLLSLGLHQRYHRTQWRRAGERLPVMFPSPDNHRPDAPAHGR